MKGVTGTDPFEGLETPVARRLIKGPRKRKRKLPPRMTYYLPKELCQQIKEIAQENEVPVSDVAHYALQQFVDRYHEGEIELEPKSEVVRKKLV